MPHIYTVTDLTRAIKEVLESEFPFVWVQGQVGNLSRPGSGHLYFTLKDDQASLDVVWFKSNQKISFNLHPKDLGNGREITCAGRLTVYTPRGRYQVIAELVQGHGLGNLHLQFEALKKKLSDQGLFDLKTKKTLPSFPERIGVITAPQGAAIRDFLRLSQDRGTGADIRIYPTLVQGEGSVENICFALEQANLEKWAQVLVLIRGGGSLEDLWSFNTEEVAQAIYNSRLPIITGIGHQIDQTIADLVADFQAATPSHAAQILWPERVVLLQQLDELENAIHQAWKNLYKQKNNHFIGLEKALTWLSPKQSLLRQKEQLENLNQRLERSIKTFIQQKRNLIDRKSSNLIGKFPKAFWEHRHNLIDGLRSDLKTGFRSHLSKKEHSLDLLSSRLQGLDPTRPLEKGYSLVKIIKNDQVLQTRSQVDKGDLLNIRTLKDTILARTE